MDTKNTAELFVKQIQAALGTVEIGENLVAVARAAHYAEQELAAYELYCEAKHEIGEEPLIPADWRELNKCPQSS